MNVEDELAINAQIDPLLRHLEAANPGGVLGVYLIGAAVSSGLRPDSDVDVLVVTERSLCSVERDELVHTMMEISGWKGHRARFPEVAERRPIELTSLVAGATRTWPEAPSRDFQYGEWLREDFVRGILPQPTNDPDVIILAACAHSANRALSGPDLVSLVAPVPPETLRKAMQGTLPTILQEIEGDERNVLLTLARILVTLETGRIVAKDVAADTIMPTLPRAHREILQRARDGYLGHAADAWAKDSSETIHLARALAKRAEQFG